MKCTEIRKIISLYIDGELERETKAAVKKHLAECEACAVEASLLESTAKAVGSVSEIEPPAFLLESIRAATVERKSVMDRVRSAFRPFPAYARMAAAAIAVAAVILVIGQTNVQPPMNELASTPDPVKIIAEKTVPVETKSTVVEPAAVSVKKPVAAAHKKSVRTRVVEKVESSKEVVGREPVVAAKPDEAVSEPAAEETFDIKKEEEKINSADSGREGFVIASSNLAEEESSPMEMLREKLAARNASRIYIVERAGAEEIKVSYGIAKLKF